MVFIRIVIWTRGIPAIKSTTVLCGYHYCFYWFLSNYTFYYARIEYVYDLMLIVMQASVIKSVFVAKVKAFWAVTYKLMFLSRFLSNFVISVKQSGTISNKTSVIIYKSFWLIEKWWIHAEKLVMIYF